MGKLLAWGDALFLVRCELGKLQIQRLTVDAKEKKVSLHPCSVEADRTAALPVNARLVAAKEVEDTELAVRYPVLVFHASRKNDTELTIDSSPASRKRRRSAEEKETSASNDDLVPPRAEDRLFFCVLYETESDGEIGFKILNMVEIPTHVGASDDKASRHDSNSRQYFLTDGPYVLLFHHYSQVATVLKLRRRTLEGGDFGFYVWLEQVDVFHRMDGDAATPFDLVSCVYVTETYSTRPHMLIHATRSSSEDSGIHNWSILDLDDEGRDGINKATSQCHYLSRFSDITLSPEQVTCCCFISEMGEWDFTASAFSETTAISSWDNGPNTTRSSRTDIGVSTLVVIGTTTNTIYVHENGILLASYVLPTRPAEICVLCEDTVNQHHVLCVRCDDAKRSFFMLSFSSNVQNVSMDLLLSFNHVGHAYTGNFDGIHADASESPQVLLLNDVCGVIESSNYRVGNELDADKSVDDGQLVKRSVLIAQKPSATEVKLSCHRLRLREDSKSKHGSRSRKRSRNNEKSGGKSDPSRSKSEPFHYIERTQKASSRDVNLIDDESDDPASNLAASQALLGKLVSSLSARLNNGLLELKRLQVIVGDKYSLARQLNQLIARQWQKQQIRANQGKEHSLLTPLISGQETGNLPSESIELVDMETIVSAPNVTTIPRNAVKGKAVEHASGSSMDECKFGLQVALEQFRLLEYIPSSSLIYAEAYLKNLSDVRLDDTFVVLTAPRGVSAEGWKCTCSVVPTFSPAADSAAGRARFQLEIQFAPTFSFLRERKPLEMMLWLHWSASREEQMTLDWRPSESALAVAPVKVYPGDVLSIGRETPTKCNDGVWTKDQERLLFISSGSNLSSLFAKPSFGIPTSAASAIRPTFSLVDLNVKSRELVLYELSRMVANLPPDVYVMRNPLEHSHLRALHSVLRSTRQEILASQQQMTKAKVIMQGQQNQNTKAASIRRSMQRNTDLHAIRLLQELQKRVNFHTMWFDTTATVKTSDQ
ncbi:hypothetical protein F441_17355 [Phytophthora nicotianae CJ01A1]|uniref:Uncharacterized protein n=2 Tax=Phytophthora nicotianae TaxID=4792 RepID=W2G2V9_PHYNI|nr:hypothetical protein L915_17018 [Phytophthora nicotianae]ETL30058.1 hypothetical protein L916_16916 [Phytophthora nicotianae]ETP06202.1 hypothetical protein F441_17355 [Phytophthora nicotianae CJ01A1]